MLVVKALVSENHNEHLGKAVLPRRLGDVVLDFLFKAVHIRLVLQLNPERLINNHAEITAGLNK